MGQVGHPLGPAQRRRELPAQRGRQPQVDVVRAMGQAKAAPPFVSAGGEMLPLPAPSVGEAPVCPSPSAP
eukprot:712876-Pyramimonas_sp.AAC.1